MRKVLFSLTLLATFAIAFNACKKEEPLDREQFLGSYAAARDCDVSSNASYNLTIEISAVSDTKVLIKNMTNQGVADILTGDISGTSITFAEQTLSIGGGVSYILKSGTGTINGNTLTINYSYAYEAGGVTIEEPCVLTCSKL